jgi:hypothetical protein
MEFTLLAADAGAFKDALEQLCAAGLSKTEAAAELVRAALQTSGLIEKN